MHFNDNPGGMYCFVKCCSILMGYREADIAILLRYLDSIRRAAMYYGAYISIFRILHQTLL